MITYANHHKSPIWRIKKRLLIMSGHCVPSQLWIGLTHKCQCSCEHCAVDSNSTKLNLAEELTTSEVKRLMSQAKKLCTREIVFTGGEPLLRDDISLLVAHSKNLNLKSTVFTNGILLKDNLISELRKAGISKFNISLDSSNSHYHDRFRAYDGCFEKAVAGIQLIVSAGIKCSIWTHVSKTDIKANNLADTKNLIKLGKSLGVQNIFILFAINAGRWRDRKTLLLDENERKIVRQLYDPPFVLMEFPDEFTPCQAGNQIVYINPEGEVCPCQAVHYPVANIRSEPLRSALRKLRKQILQLNLDSTGQCLMNKYDKIGKFLLQ